MSQALGDSRPDGKIRCPSCLGRSQHYDDIDCDFCGNEGLVEWEERPDADIYDAMRLYNFYLQGFLPDAGGVSDQSATLMAAFAHLDGVTATHQQDQIREQQIRQQQMAAKNHNPTASHGPPRIQPRTK